MSRKWLGTGMQLGLLGGLAFLASDRQPALPTPVPETVTEFFRAPAFDGSLRDAFISFLANDEQGIASAETANYLLSRRVRIELRSFDSERVLAEFDADNQLIALNPRRVAPKFVPSEMRALDRNAAMKSLDALWATEPIKRDNFIVRASWLIVHEARHGHYTEATGTSWNSAEQESACRTYELLFLVERLRRDPNFLDLSRYNNLMRIYLTGVDDQDRELWSQPQQWWREPLPNGVYLAQVEEAARRIQEDYPGRFENLGFHWFLLHQAALDPSAYWEALDGVMPADYDSVDQDPKRHLAGLRLRRLDLDARLRAAPAGALRARLAREVRELDGHLEADEAFYADEGRVGAYKAFFRMERSRLTGLLRGAVSRL